MQVEEGDVCSNAASITFAGHEDYSGQIVLVKEGGQWKIAAGTSIKNTGG